MRVLVISHTVFSRTNNMGKTLLTYFDRFQPEELAQFYIQAAAPEEAACQRYYRFTDLDALRSVFKPAVQGRSMEAGTAGADGEKKWGAIKHLYRCGAKRTAAVYLFRNLLWKFSRWNSPSLRQWVRDFAPDVVFLAAGDYGFLYHFARELAQLVRKPLVVACVDDFYCYRKAGNTLAGKLEQTLFLKSVYKTMAQAAEIYTISEPMQRQYEKCFGKPCRLLHTPAQCVELPGIRKNGKISYLGNLGLGRAAELAEMGRALKRIRKDGVPKWIDVYSAEQDPQILKQMSLENGIRFHGAVSPERVSEILAESMAVIHVESFAPEMRPRIRFSVSTKIAESLRSGACMIAYGPEGIASIDYLKIREAGFVITDPTRLQAGLEEILTNESLRVQIQGRARKLGEENHSMEAGPEKLREWLEQLCRKEGAGT